MDFMDIVESVSRKLENLEAAEREEMYSSLETGGIESVFASSPDLDEALEDANAKTIKTMMVIFAESLCKRRLKAILKSPDVLTNLVWGYKNAEMRHDVLNDWAENAVPRFTHLCDLVNTAIIERWQRDNLGPR